MLLNEQPLLETVEAHLLKPLMPSEMIPIAVQVINSGKGPARNIDIIEGILASDKWIFDLTGNEISHSGTLGIHSGVSGPQITVTKSISLTVRGIEQINAGSVHLYIYGTVQYEQPETEKPVRQGYSYCLYYVPALDKIQPSPFADCPAHPPLPR